MMNPYLSGGIREDDLTGSEIIDLLTGHLNDMAQVSPPESCHALDLEDLRKPGITFWTIWDGSALAGCGALKKIDDAHAEIKSMRTARAYFRCGVASQMLRHMIAQAKIRGDRRLSLETGSMAFFEPARKLYLRFGFEYCSRFGSYIDDPNSVFMTLEI